jgi:competence protein ComEA
MPFPSMSDPYDLPQRQFEVSQQQTMVHPDSSSPPFTDEQATQLLSIPQTPTMTPLSLTELIDIENRKEVERKNFKVRLRRSVIIIAIVLAGCIIYFIWQPSIDTNTSTVPITKIALSTVQTNKNSPIPNNTLNGVIQVYVTGAVKRPGVYTLSSDARIYQLLQAAGGPLPDADLVSLNLASKLVDGEEVYVSRIGEGPSSTRGDNTTTTNTTNAGNLVNINTAILSELTQKLHLSTKSAQAIIDYRTQHGRFTSIDQLLQAVSQSIYNKIKNLVTV